MTSVLLGHIGSLLMLSTSVLALTAGACRFTIPGVVHALDLTTIILSAILLCFLLLQGWFLIGDNAANMKRRMYSHGFNIFGAVLPYALLVILYLILCSVDYCDGVNNALSIALIVFASIGVLWCLLYSIASMRRRPLIVNGQVLV